MTKHKKKKKKLKDTKLKLQKTLAQRTV